MNADELQAAFEESMRIMRIADVCALRAVNFSAGKLRRLCIGEGTLRELKRELRNFNSRTGKWKF